jgi:hypothetical protein
MALSVNKNLNLSYFLSTDYHIAIHEQGDIPYQINKDLLIKDAYIKILSVQGDKDSIGITVGIYQTSDKAYLIKTEHYKFIPDISVQSNNFIQQGYEYLKGLHEYANAIDVLEEGQTL